MYNFLLRFLSPMTILLALSGIFYTVMHFYASGVLAGTSSVPLLEKVLALRMIFSGVFCVMLGYLGVKLTGHVWPAMVVHTSVVAALLLLDIPLEQVVQHWDISVLVLASVASLTGVAGGLTLGLFWLRMKYPRAFLSKKSFRKKSS